MPRVVVLPHPELCPQGALIEAAVRRSLCDALLEGGIAIEHACEKSGACATCHVVVREGLDSLAPPDEEEEDMLDRVWGLTGHSRLSCRAKLGGRDLVIEIPRYTVNQTRERSSR